MGYKHTANSLYCYVISTDPYFYAYRRNVLSVDTCFYACRIAVILLLDKLFSSSCVIVSFIVMGALLLLDL